MPAALHRPGPGAALAGLGMCLVAVGAMLVGVSVHRGRHRAGRLAGH